MVGILAKSIMVAARQDAPEVPEARLVRRRGWLSRALYRPEPGKRS